MQQAIAGSSSERVAAVASYSPYANQAGEKRAAASSQPLTYAMLWSSGLHERSLQACMLDALSQDAGIAVLRLNKDQMLNPVVLAYVSTPTLFLQRIGCGDMKCGNPQWSNTEVKMESSHSWVEKNAKVRQKDGVPTDAPRWTNGKTLRGVDGPRVFDLLDLAFQSARVKRSDLSEQAVEDMLICDTSQSGARRPWMLGGCLRNLNTSSVLFSYSKRRVLTGYEHLQLLGFVAPEVSGLTDHQLRSLSGEAMSLPQGSARLYVMAIVVESPCKSSRTQDMPQVVGPRQQS
eukprot:6490622-Amphidinium_carterae.1